MLKEENKTTHESYGVADDEVQDSEMNPVVVDELGMKHEIKGSVI